MSDYVVTRKRRRTYAQAIDPCLGYYLHDVGDTRSGAPEMNPLPNILAVQAEKRRERTRSTVPTSFDGERELEMPSELSVAVHRGGTPGRRHTAGSVMAEHELSENASVLSVEKFLKRSRNPPVNLRRYRGKRRAGRLVSQNTSPEDPNGPHSDSEEAMIRLRSRKIPRGNLDDSELETSSYLMTSSPAYEPLSSSPMHELGKTVRQKKAPRQRQNLRARLYEAAVSTYGYMDPNFMDPAAEARRGDILDSQMRVKPLRFVPGSAVQPRTRSPSHENRRKFVDPRNSNAIRTASFLSSSKHRTARIASNSDSAVLMNVLDRLPAEKWVLDLDFEENPPSGRNLRTRRQKSTLKRKHDKDSLLTASGQISECPPLVFVDFKEAEAAYANIFLVERNRAEGDKRVSPMQQPTHLAPALKLNPLQAHTHKSACSGSPIVRVPSSGNRPMVSNHRRPNSQGIEVVDRANNNLNIDVTSPRLPDELDPKGGRSPPSDPSVYRIPKVPGGKCPEGSSQTTRNCPMETQNRTKKRNDKPLRPLVSFENIRNVGTGGG